MTIRILHLEDDPIDLALVAETLRADGIDCVIVHVDSRGRFEAALAQEPFDLILADYQLPSFDGLKAQTIAAERVPDVPFLFVSGTLGEEIAIERLKNGAVDYVLKQRLSRLPSSVRRALAEAETRREQRRAESELRQLNAELDARVAHRTAELASANAALATREQQLKESEARLQAILDHSPAAIVVKDLEGRFQLVNRRFELAVGRPSAEIIGRTDQELFVARLADIYQANDRQVIETGAPVEVEEPAIESGRVHIYSASKFSLLDSSNRPYAICGISLDVTERRHAEEAVKISAREAERANQAKSEFLSRMSHDLRTPLNAILGFAQVLQSDGLSPSQQDSVGQILRGGHHLLALINEVLDIARIESGHLSLSNEPVPVAEVVGHVAGLVRPLAEQRAIALAFEDVEPSLHVVADRQRLTQVLLNLLSNAIKYNRPGGKVTIAYQHTADGKFRIAVSDTGVGISNRKLRLLFQPFERLGAEHTAVEGTGLGLALSKGLAEAMGGTLGVETAPDVGSTFWVELATAEAAFTTVAVTDATLAAPAFETNAVHGTVLYIEDNSSNVKLIERVLQRRPGVTLLTAGTGQAGFDAARTISPQVVLLDLHLPDISGEEVLQLLLAEPRTRSVPVVILSADATPQQVRRLKDLGASGYLTKPLDIARVLETIDGYLARSHGQQ